MVRRKPVFTPRTDGTPRRSLTSLNARFEDKAVFDLVHSWWCLRDGRALSQCDAFNRVLALALEHPEADLPSDLDRPRA